MYKDRTPSDSELILGSFFVVCILFGVNLLGSQSPRQIVMTPAVMTAAAVPAVAPSGQTNSPTASCLEELKNTNTNYGKDYKCLPGCEYTVKVGWGATVQVVPKGTPSKTKEPPGRVFYEALIGSKKGPYICPTDGTVVSVSQNNINDLNSLAYKFEAAAPTANTTVGAPTNLLPKSWDAVKSPLSNVPSYGADLKSTTDWNRYNYGYFGLEPLSPAGTLPEVPSTDLSQEFSADAIDTDPNSVDVPSGEPAELFPLDPGAEQLAKVGDTVTVGDNSYKVVECPSYWAGAADGANCFQDKSGTVHSYIPSQVPKSPGVPTVATPASAPANATQQATAPTSAQSTSGWAWGWDRVLGRRCFLFYCQ